MLKEKNNKVIITCAMTGGIHVPTMSDYLPVTPEEIAQQSIDAANAGASILHLHARDPENGRPTSDPEIFNKFLPVIKEETDAVINITTGGGLQMTVEQRLEAPLKFRPEMCSLNMGSMNFGLFPMLNRFTEFKHDWEADHLNGSRDAVFKNTFADIELILRKLNFNSFVVKFLSTGNELPYPAALPKGFWSAILYAELIKIKSSINVTMFHGEKDESVPTSFSRKVLRIFFGAKKKLIIIKNGDHGLSSKKSLKRMLRELDGFRNSAF